MVVAFLLWRRLLPLSSFSVVSRRLFRQLCLCDVGRQLQVALPSLLVWCLVCGCVDDPIQPASECNPCDVSIQPGERSFPAYSLVFLLFYQLNTHCVVQFVKKKIPAPSGGIRTFSRGAQPFQFRLSTNDLKNRSVFRKSGKILL